MATSRRVFLCGGLQSSGSTLASWCFLQRHDMDGVLDAAFDFIPSLPTTLSAPLAWCKFTIACFRISEVRKFFEDEGHDVRPLLITRDPRAVFNSLVTKKYGRNGTTAEDPPLRLRLMRYLEDWRLFRDRGWPIVRYEDLVHNPEATLRRTCDALDLPWDDAMIHWPKPIESIAAAANGNKTFAATRSGGLLNSVVPELAEVRTDRIPPNDLEWIDRELHEMNTALGYPAHIDARSAITTSPRAVPNFECTRRHRHETRKHGAAKLLASLTSRVLPRGLVASATTHAAKT
jgi:hypothetical protein